MKRLRAESTLPHSPPHPKPICRISGSDSFDVALFQKPISYAKVQMVNVGKGCAVAEAELEAALNRNRSEAQSRKSAKATRMET